MSEPLVAVLILNTNKRDDTLACLRSLADQSWRRLDVIVLDNHSTDGSVEAIRAEHPSVTVVSLADNRGYAGNNNVGIELARQRGADWVFVLNEDTIVDRRCIEALVQHGEQHPELGVLGPLVLHHDEPAVIQSAGGWFDEAWEAGHLGANADDQGQYREPYVVSWVTGCSIFVRRAVIEQIGGIDERFFYYWEETEWCVRAGRAGWQIAVVPRARLWHKGVTRHYVPSPNVSYYHTRNRLLLMRTHGAPVTRLALEIFRICKTLTSWSVRPKWRHLREHRRAVAAGLRDFARHRWGQRPQHGV